MKKASIVIALLVTAPLISVATGQPAERSRVVVSDGKSSLLDLVRPTDDLVIVEPSWYRTVIVDSEMKRVKTLYEEIQELDVLSGSVVIATVGGSRSFLLKDDTAIETTVEVRVESILKDTTPPSLQKNTIFSFQQGGGEIRYGQSRIRTLGYVPFSVGARYVFAFRNIFVNRPPILVGWIMIDGDGRLTQSVPRDGRSGSSSSLYGLKVEALVEELRQRQEDGQRNRRFPARDESFRDESFAEFHGALLAAASDGDVEGLRELIAATVSVPEATVSREEFLKGHVRPGQPWTELLEALKLGAVAISESEFVAPYLANETSLDADMVAMGHDVRLRQSPSQNGRVVRYLDYHAVRVLLDHRTDFEARSPTDPLAWAHVSTDAGESGYVFVGLLRSRGDARFYFERINGVWKLVAYGSGD